MKPSLPAVANPKPRVVSLQARLVIAFLLIAFLPRLALLVSTEKIARDAGTRAGEIALEAGLATRRTEIAHENEQAARMALLGINGKIAEQESDLHSLAQSSSLQAVSPDALGLVQGRVDQGGDLLRLSLVDTNGQIVTAAAHDVYVDPTHLGSISSPGLLATIRLGQTYYGPVTRDPVTALPSMVLAVPVDGFAGDVVGALVATVNLSFLEQSIGADQQSQAVQMLVADDGTVLASPNPQPVFPLGQGYPMVPAAALRGDQGTVIEGTDLVSYAADHQLHWRVLVREPLSIALAPVYAAQQSITAGTQAVVQQGQRQAILLGVFSILLGLVVGIVMARQFARPLRTLVEATELLAKGQLDHRTGLRGSDELGRLGAAFDVMAAQLQEAHSTLERRVHERTLELEQATANLRVFKQMADLAPFALITTDLDGRVTYANPTTATVFGDTPTHFLGLAINELAAGYTVETHEESARIPWPLSDGAWHDVRFIQRSNGSFFWAHVFLFPVHDSDGEMVSVAGWISDLTAVKRAEANHLRTVRLAAFRASIATSLAQGHSLLAMLEECAAAVVTYLDAALTRIWTVDEAQGPLELKASAGLPMGSDGKYDRSPVATVNIGRIAQEQVPHLTNDVINDPYLGDQAWLQREGMAAFAGYPLIVDARTVGVLAVFARQPLDEDAHATLAVVAALLATGIERKRVAESQRETQALLVRTEKLASIGQLAAGVAHEINNPIGYINSNLTSLAEYVRDLTRYLSTVDQFQHRFCLMSTAPCAKAFGEVRALRSAIDLDYLVDDMGKLVGESQEGAQRVKKIVQDLKTFSRADDVEVVDVDLNVVIESALNIVWNELKYTCAVCKELETLPPIKCNPHQIGQVFVNLLVNAGQAIEPGRPGIITIRTEVRDGWVVGEVSDNGKGIRPEHLGRIFDPFFTTKPPGQGTGLGLAISHGIVGRHGGRILVASELGSGTSFSVELPAIPLAAAADQNQENAPEGGVMISTGITLRE